VPDTSAERVAEGIEAFGRWLRRERELRGLPREEVARLTKLAPGIIESLESGQAERIPPRAYLLGYLRSYASAVGLDADDVVLRFQEIEGVAETASTPRMSPGRRRAWLGIAAGLVIALAAAAAAVLSRCSA